MDGRVRSRGDSVRDSDRPKILGESVDARLTEEALANVPDALAVVCVRATIADHERRFRSSREFQAAVQAFLDGELDTERRAEESVRLTREAKLQAEALASTADELDARHRIIRAVGRAHALDPNNRHAIETLLEVTDTPMEAVPAEVEALAADAHLDRIRRMGKIAALAYAGQLLHLPWILSLDVLRPAYLWGFYICMAFSAAAAYWTHRRPSETNVLVCLVVSALGTSMLTGLLGPLLLMPMFGIVNAATFALVFSGRRMSYPAAIGALSIVGPYLLARGQVLPDVYSFLGTELSIRATAISLGSSAEFFLLGSNAVTLLVGAIVIALLSRRIRDAERRTLVQSWHFRQLLPASTSR